MEKQRDEVCYFFANRGPQSDLEHWCLFKEVSVLCFKIKKYRGHFNNLAKSGRKKHLLTL